MLPVIQELNHIIQIANEFISCNQNDNLHISTR